MDLSVKAHELATKLTSIQRLLNQFGPWHQGTQADSKEYWLIQRQNILLSSLLTSCFFFWRYKPFLARQGLGVTFHCLRLLSSGSLWLFGPGFYRRCCGNANIEGAGFNLVRPRPPSKWTEHIVVCLVTFKLSRWQAAIHRINCSRSGIPAA